MWTFLLTSRQGKEERGDSFFITNAGFSQVSLLLKIGRITALLTSYRIFTGQLLPILLVLRLIRHRKRKIVQRWRLGNKIDKIVGRK